VFLCPPARGRVAPGRAGVPEPHTAAAAALAGGPARREKIAAARRGKPRPWHVMEPAQEAREGSRHTEETRWKTSEAHRRRGARLPKAARLWTPGEDALVRTLPAVYAAQQTGRTLKAVYNRRAVLRAADPTPETPGAFAGRRKITGGIETARPPADSIL
jgi:hypothetical protein